MNWRIAVAGIVLALIAYIAPPINSWVVPALIGVAVLGALGFWLRKNAWLVERPFFYRSTSSLSEIQPSPLLEMQGPVSLWDGIPVGFRKNGTHLVISPTDTSILVAGEPRAGKTVFLNNIIAAAAMDPRCRLALFDGKGSNEFHRWKAVADKVDRTANPGALLSYLTTVYQEIRRRYDALAEMDRVKLTREIYETSMPLYLVVIDELAKFTKTYPNKKIGQGIVQVLADIAAQGPAAGVLLVLATQRTATEVVPGIIRDNVSMRVAFRVPNPTSSNLILGVGMAKKGYDASQIRKITERGIGLADVDGGWPTKFRTFMLTYDETRPVAEKARLLRQGNHPQPLPELPPEDDNAVPSRSLPDDIRIVWPKDAERLHNIVILQLLQRLDPAYYGDWSQQLLGRRLRDVGLAKYITQWTEGDRRNYKGLPRTALDVALEPDDGTTPDERRREREEMAMEALDDLGLMAYQAKVAEIERATQCEYCEDPLTPDNPPTVDHWIPLAKGGTNQASNLRAACRPCNSSKRDHEPVTWLRERLRKAA